MFSGLSEKDATTITVVDTSPPTPSHEYNSGVAFDYSSRQDKSSSNSFDDDYVKSSRLPFGEIALRCCNGPHRIAIYQSVVTPHDVKSSTHTHTRLSQS